MNIGIIANKYKIKYKIDEGGFGDIYLGSIIETNENILIKLEFKKCGSRNSLIKEYEIYKQLNNNIYFPKIHLYTQERESNILILDLNGPSIKKIFSRFNKQFSLKTILMLSIQILKRLEFIHSKNIIHCDIKPDNIILGAGKNLNIIQLIDFGISEFYYNLENNTHKLFKENQGFKGTITYSSINAQKEVSLSRRDDLESFGYMMIYLLKGSLPWSSLDIKEKKEKKKKILEIKETITNEELCKYCPVEFKKYFDYCKNLQFDETPDYKYLIGLFDTLFLEKKYIYDNKYDWMI